jgi:hypothetical protein|tara:strand:- start:143 stop:544 length:402 start_codon:yes stop_codon:yes gene_type:complete
MPAVSSATDEVKARIDAIESSYEFFLAYAAQGLTTDEGAKAGAQLREFLAKIEKAINGLPELVTEAVAGREPSDSWADVVAMVRSDATAALAMVRLISARPGVSSELIDNLNAFIHMRALLTDLFLVDDLLEG